MSSLANDVFDGLTRGMKFNKKNNSIAIDISKRVKSFIQSDYQTKQLSSPRATSNYTTNVELDFFGEINSSQNNKLNENEKVTQKREKMSKLGDIKRNAANGVNSLVEQNENKTFDNETISSFRKRLRIRVKGTDVAFPMETFSKESLLGHNIKRKQTSKQSEQLASIILRNIESSKYVEPTPIQMQAIPVMLGGRDMLGIAPTGSGKTAAFLIPLIMHLANEESKDALKSKVHRGQIESLIVAPTRELAKQIFREFEKLSNGKHFRACILRKMTEGNILASLSGKDGTKGFHLVVCTPMSLVVMIQDDRIDLKSVKMLVLDEADKLFEMGFLQQVDIIVNACGRKTQRAMFSATMPQQIEHLVQSVLRDPVEIVVGIQNAGADTIDQKLIFVGQEQGKMIALRQLISKGELIPPTLMFVQSKERCKELYAELMYEGIRVDSIHSERTQAQREQTIQDFRRGKVWVLLCTDLLGRGIDFKGVNCVVNYDFPTSAVTYIHRIGRTGRAERRGKAITFFTLDDVENLRMIANVVRLNGCDVPEWMLELKRNRTKTRELEKRPIKRAPIRTSSGYDRKRSAKRRNMVKQSKEGLRKQES